MQAIAKLTLPPEVTLASAAGVAQGLKAMLSAGLGDSAGVVVDASRLTGFDSSALAVLLECRRQALAGGKRFSVHGLPARLRQLAGLYGVAELLPAASEAGMPAGV